MGPVGWAELVSLLILLLVLGGLVLGIVLIVTGGRKGSAGEMACGRCGYAVRGLEQLACPECGADLREAGIARGGSSGKRTLGIVLVSLCGFLLLSCCGLMAIGFLAAGTSVRSAPVQAYPTQQSTPAQQGAVADPAQAQEDGPADDDAPLPDAQP